MAIIQKTLPLFNKSFYGYSTSLEGNTFYLTFEYKKRINHWLFSLSDAEQNVLVSGQKLTPDTPLFYDYRLPNLTGYFLFTPIKDQDPETLRDRIRNPSQFFRLYYFYDNGE